MARKKNIAFVGHSFSRDDAGVISLFKKTISSRNIRIVSGERPEAKVVGEKVKKRIDSSNIFVGILTRRHFINGLKTWTTSPWIVEEKGYSLGQNSRRPIVLLVEKGISIPTETGGLEGDLEYIRFERSRIKEAQRSLELMLKSL